MFQSLLKQCLGKRMSPKETHKSGVYASRCLNSNFTLYYLRAMNQLLKLFDFQFFICKTKVKRDLGDSVSSAILSQSFH